MSLRVIGGEFRGRVLKSVKGSMTRPLLGQAREAIFDILGPRIVDAEVWDLFAGTGATGIEALSRGARLVTFVEKARQAIEVLEDNLEMLGEAVQSRTRVVRGDAWLPPVGDDPATEPRAPDVIFLDPPYAMVAEDPSKSTWRAHQLVGHLAPRGVLCFHFEGGLLDVDDFDMPVDLRRYGRCQIAILRRPGEAPAERQVHDVPESPCHGEDVPGP